jgi:hypothetical protein
MKDGSQAVVSVSKAFPAQNAVKRLMGKPATDSAGAEETQSVAAWKGASYYRHTRFRRVGVLVEVLMPALLWPLLFVQTWLSNVLEALKEGSAVPAFAAGPTGVLLAALYLSGLVYAVDRVRRSWQRRVWLQGDMIHMGPPTLVVSAKDVRDVRVYRTISGSVTGFALLTRTGDVEVKNIERGEELLHKLLGILSCSITKEQQPSGLHGET